MSGLGNCVKARSLSTLPPAMDQASHKASVVPPTQIVGKPANLTREADQSSKKRNCATDQLNGMKEFERNLLEEMPSVSTKGDGPNGRRIEGFLYKYRKGEELRIVCVCHGSFLTPAEFVKHAGGSDVANPLRHIVVNPTP